jgi:hypothetical protein
VLQSSPAAWCHSYRWVWYRGIQLPVPCFCSPSLAVGSAPLRPTFIVSGYILFLLFLIAVFVFRVFLMFLLCFCTAVLFPCSLIFRQMLPNSSVWGTEHIISTNENKFHIIKPPFLLLSVEFVHGKIDLSCALLW